MSFFNRISFLAAIFLLAAFPYRSVASVVYLVTANTSSIAGQSGYLDLQLEPGPSSTNPSTASVTGFTTDGSLTGPATLTGDVTGQLPGTLTFDNNTVLNDYFQPTTFGTTESFDVTLSGPSPIGGGPTNFNIAFYASDQSTPLLTTSPDGNAGQIVINGDGSTTPSTNAAAIGAPSALTITLVPPVSSVPEPSQESLVGLMLVGMFVLLRKTLAFPFPRSQN